MRNSPGAMSMTSDDLLSALRWRYATKQFDPSRAIPDPTWSALEESLVLTPSSFGLQPWKFIVVKDPAVRAALQEKSWNQAQVTQASHFVVLAARTDNSSADIEAWIACLAEATGKTPADFEMLHGMITGFNGMMDVSQRHEWNRRQVYIALGQLMTAAAVLGVDTCPMEGIDPAAYDSILGLEGSGYATVVACALGYRDPADKYASTPKARFPRERVLEER